jgi:cytochrome c-type biogenesis protein CcmH/NrfG
MLHRGSDAATEFRKILDHPGLVANDPMGALARLQLARAYVQSGDAIRAKAAYSDFLNLWKTADQGLPVLQQSQLEFDRLEGRSH